MRIWFQGERAISQGCTLRARKWLKDRGAKVTLILVTAAFPLGAQGTDQATVTVRPGSSVVLGQPAPCLRVVQAPTSGSIEIARVSDQQAFAIYRASQATSGETLIILGRGSGTANDSTPCQAEVQDRFTVTTDATPEVPSDALTKAFRILMAAFVLALLLESAFALLFNWRLFLEFFVGKAWRTPIMFVGALIVVRSFNMDLTASLIDAYNPRPSGAPSPQGWFTSVLTAMVLAGGTLGVNRILVALGFRSQLRQELDEPKPEPQEAFIAVRVRGMKSTRDAEVQVEELAPPAGLLPTFGLLRKRPIQERLSTLLFSKELRVPASGGHRIDPTKAYRVVVRAVDRNGAVSLFGPFGKKLNAATDSEPMQFAPRAIVDFDVTIP